MAVLHCLLCLHASPQSSLVVSAMDGATGECGHERPGTSLCSRKTEVPGVSCQLCPTSIFKLSFPMSGAARCPPFIPACESSVLPELLRSCKLHLLNQIHPTSKESTSLKESIRCQAAHPSQSPKPDNSKRAHGAPIPIMIYVDYFHQFLFASFPPAFSQVHVVLVSPAFVGDAKESEPCDTIPECRLIISHSPTPFLPFI